MHRHNAQGFIYVLEGSIVMQVKGGKEVTLTSGQALTQALRMFSFIYETVLKEQSEVRSIMGRRYLREGERFSEMPGDRHALAENASKTEPAKLLATTRRIMNKSNDGPPSRIAPDRTFPRCPVIGTL